MTSLGEEHNPYAAPQAELQVQSIQSGPVAFYPMSSRKAAVMSVITFGFYDVLFWFRHWSRLQHNGHDVTPLFRAFFAGLTSFGFVTRLCTARAERGIESGSALRASPGIYLGLNIAARLSDQFLAGIPGLAFTVLGAACSAWVLATVQHAANEVLAADSYRGPSNSGITGGAIFAGAVGMMLWFFVMAGAVWPGWFVE